MNPLQAALVGAGLAKPLLTQEPATPTASISFFSPQLGEKETTVRIYLEDGNNPTEEMEQAVESLVRSFGFVIGFGQDIEAVCPVIPGRFDRRRWIQIECRSSLIAGQVLEQVRANPPQDVPFTRITTPGIQA